jgi:hypothetical protein
MKANSEITRSFAQSREDLFLILNDRLEAALVPENSRLILQNACLILLDGGLICPKFTLIGDDRLLILDDSLLIRNHFVF